MADADDTATRFAMMSAELLNGMAFLLRRGPGEQGDVGSAEQLAILKRVLRDEVRLMGSMSPDRIEGPENFDLDLLVSEASKLLALLEAWSDPDGEVPEEVRSCALRMMRAMGIGDAQIAAFGG